jgi:hypothetical protein
VWRDPAQPAVDGRDVVRQIRGYVRGWSRREFVRCGDGPRRHGDGSLPAPGEPAGPRGCGGHPRDGAPEWSPGPRGGGRPRLSGSPCSPSPWPCGPGCAGGSSCSGTSDPGGALGAA